MSSCFPFVARVTSSSNEPLDLMLNHNFRCDLFRLSESLCLEVDPLQADFVRIGAAVYAADRLIRRPRLTRESFPSRELQIECTVSDTDFWAVQADRIAAILSFLSGDRIEMSFLPGRSAKSCSVTRRLYKLELEEVAMYSGGLDSAAGLVAHTASNDRDLFIVTAEHQPHQRGRIRRQLAGLPKFLRRVEFASARTSLLAPPRLSEQERSQRLRGFLFAAVGGAAAARLGVSKVLVFEHGIGSLNLPVIASMSLGGLATRGAHPAFFRMMSELATAVAGTSIRYLLPFQWETKGEVVAAAVEQGGLDVIKHAVSCVHYPQRRPGPAKQCGVCPACIDHQVAMHAAGSSVTRETFHVDPRFLPSAADDAAAVRLLEAHAIDLEKLQDREDVAGLADHLSITGEDNSDEAFDRWATLHVTYARQVRSWLQDGRAEGSASPPPRPLAKHNVSLQAA